MLKNVIRFRTHTSLFAKNWGNLDAQFPNASKTYKGLVMTAEQAGIQVSMPGKDSFLVPWGNIVLAEFSDKPEDVKTNNS